MIFSGTFTAGGLKLQWPEGKLQVVQEGRESKFVERVTQLSYSGAYAKERGQRVLYITERAVFAARDGVLTLVEIGPGVDLERDVLAHMAFRPRVAPDLKTMDARLFRPEPMNLAADLAAKAPIERSPRLARIAG
jgi:propionate CoA-transferase